MKTVPGRVWLQADVPIELADEFAAHARRLERSVRAQLRVVVAEFVEQQDRELERGKRPAGERVAA